MTWARRCDKCKGLVEWRGMLSQRPSCPGCGAKPKSENDARDARIVKRYDAKHTGILFPQGA